MSDLPAKPVVTSESKSGGGVRIWRRRFLAFCLVGVFLFVWAFVRECRLLSAQSLNSWTEDVTADCAVVLTGGPGRIREGVDLLARRSIRKLIISGVHPQASFHEIFSLWPFFSDLNEPDVILERRSRTTFGNAQQSLPLIEALRCRDLVLITSRSHMRRALLTFRAEFPPGFPIVPRAVASATVEPASSEIVNEALKGLFYAVWAY